MFTIVLLSFHSETHIKRLVSGIEKKYPIIVIENSLNVKLKQELEEKYRLLLSYYDQLKQKIKEQNLTQKNKELKFNEKIDELNQETDILLEEIDKWQT